jgi:hypothetical protein
MIAYAMAAMFWNTKNGFSGDIAIDSLFNAMHPVILTNVCLLFYLIFD